MPVSEPTPEQKAQSPYVDAVAPYKVQESGSGKITEPLAETPKTITAISKEVIDDKAATSVRELARQTPGVTLGFAEGGNAFGDSLYIRGNGLAVRANVLFHDAHVAERDDNVEDQRWGGLLAATIKPTDAFKFTIDYYRLRTDACRTSVCRSIRAPVCRSPRRPAFRAIPGMARRDPAAISCRTRLRSSPGRPSGR